MRSLSFGILLSLIAVSSSPAFSAMKCGDFTLKAHDDGLMYINGAKPETQKIIFFDKKDDYGNVKFQWMLFDSTMGRWLGLDHINRNGKPILNVEVIRKAWMNLDGFGRMIVCG